MFLVFNPDARFPGLAFRVEDRADPDAQRLRVIPRLDGVNFRAQSVII